MKVVSRFRRHQRGNAMLAFAGSLPLLIGAVGASVDYGNLVLARGRMQAAADGAVLAAAKELRLAGTRDEAVKTTAEAYVRAALPEAPDVVVSSVVDNRRRRFAITLDRTIEGYMPSGLNPFSSEVSVQAEAQAVGGSPLCLLGLSSSMANTVQIDGSSVVANGCGVSSNSSAPNGLVVSNGGSIAALVVCSSGGLQAGGGATSPPGKTDCPRTADPLASRDGPRRERCDFRDMVVRGGARLAPGVYCQGLTIEGGGRVKLQPGVFVIKDGPLVMKDNASLEGTEAGFYLTGSRAVLDIAAETIVSLSAPVTGPLAGMLFYEDRSNAPAVHKMASNHAPLMLGTFYFPKSRFEIGSSVPLDAVHALHAKPIGRASAWTIVVARQVKVMGGLGLVLNTDYSQTDVPVPDGAGGGEVSLVR